MQQRRDLRRYAWLSIVTALGTLLLKFAAYGVTGSVGLLSDALESGVNLVTAVLALAVLIVAARPPDDEHAFGHDKAEYFSAGVEGALIVIAGATILFSAVQRLLEPQPLDQLPLGAALAAVASLLNLVTGRLLLDVGRRRDSIALQANGRHLLSDVWTSLGVIAGVGAVSLTGWFWLDPVIALAVAVHISRAGIQLLDHAIHGLMDTALPPEELAAVEAVLTRYRRKDISYHALRTRRSGAARFISFHLQVPGAWTVQAGHTLVETLEHDLRQTLHPVSVLIHLEPIEDPLSLADIPLYRPVEGRLDDND